MNWLVVYTKPNFEISCADRINSIGIEAYCPKYTQLKQYSDRKKKVIKPLLRSYIFVKVDEKNRSKVFDIPGVVRFLFWLGKPAIVRNTEIELMKNNLSGIYDSILIKKLKIGSEYNIDGGPFKGQIGKVVQMSKNYIKLELVSLGFSVFLKAA
tara:strand:- start:1246 stop:1707 length:462 start_codon:yes stop_codon:yes gene_type:complete